MSFFVKNVALILNNPDKMLLNAHVSKMKPPKLAVMSVSPHYRPSISTTVPSSSVVFQVFFRDPLDIRIRRKTFRQPFIAIWVCLKTGIGHPTCIVVFLLDPKKRHLLCWLTPFLWEGRTRRKGEFP